MAENKSELKVYFEGDTLSIRLVSSPEFADVVVGKDGELSINAEQKNLGVNLGRLEKEKGLAFDQVAAAGICEKDIEIFDREKRISDVLIKLGVPANIRGYRFIREAIIIILDNPDALHAVTKSIYPVISQKNSTTPSRVERAIRHAIEVSSARASSELYMKLFIPITRSNGKTKPTNSEFLATVAEYYRLSLKENK